MKNKISLEETTSFKQNVLERGAVSFVGTSRVLGSLGSGSWMFGRTQQLHNFENRINDKRRNTATSQYIPFECTGYDVKIILIALPI